ncbi:MerR family DNA-binding transcriptional regulator [Nocardia salmonicida]
MQHPNTLPTAGTSAADKLDDGTYPTYSLGRAAELLGVIPAFLRGLDAARLLTAQRCEGGHRRYSRYQLRIAALLERTRRCRWQRPDASCRIVILEDQLAEVHQHRPAARTRRPRRRRPV